MPLQTFFNLPEEKQKVLLDYAIEEFAAHDYDSASISRVVTQVGIAKGSFYQYFKDKQDLYQYLLQIAIDKKGQMIANSIMPTAEMGIFATLLWLFKEMAKFQISFPQLAQIGYRAINSPSYLPGDVTAKAATQTRQYFTSLFEKGKKSGEIRSDVDSEISAFIFTAALTELTPYLIEKLGIKNQSQVNTSENLLPMDKVEEVFNQIVEVLRLGISSQR